MKKYFILSIILVLMPAAVSADEIQMVSGEIFSGRILARDEQAVYMQAQGFIRNFDLSNIAAINQHDFHGQVATQREKLNGAEEFFDTEEIRTTKPLPYPLVAFAYQALSQDQLTFDPYHTQLGIADARILREMFILADRSLTAFVQTLIWLQSNHQEGRADTLLHLQIEKILDRLKMLPAPAELKPVQTALSRGIRALDQAFYLCMISEKTAAEKIAFENYLTASRLDFEKITDSLFYLFPTETERNKTAWVCHMRALLSIERGLRS